MGDAKWIMRAFFPVNGGNDETRGHAITRRRLALGINAYRAFSRLTGLSRNAITAAENDDASEQTYKRLEAWLDKAEEAGGVDAGELTDDFIEFQVSGGIVVVKGHIKNLAELQEAVRQLMDEQYKREHPEG